MNEQPVTVTVDGNPGSGKSTLARLLTQALIEDTRCSPDEIIHVNTGLFFRALASILFRKGLSPQKVYPFLDMTIHVVDADEPTAIVGGIDVSSLLYTYEVEQTVSSVAQIPRVRQRVVEAQRQLMQNARVVVLEGYASAQDFRAALSFFVSADLSTRAQRVQARYRKRFKMDMPLERIHVDLLKHDAVQEARRRLMGVPYALRIDTTGRKPQSCVDEMLMYVHLSRLHVHDRHVQDAVFA